MSQVIGQVWREVVGCRNWPVMRVPLFIALRRNDRRLLGLSLARVHCDTYIYYRFSLMPMQALLSEESGHFRSPPHTFRGYPAKRALSAMRKHGGLGPFGRIPSIWDISGESCSARLDGNMLSTRSSPESCIKLTNLFKGSLSSLACYFTHAKTYARSYLNTVYKVHLLKMVH